MFTIALISAKIASYRSESWDEAAVALSMLNRDDAVPTLGCTDADIIAPY